MEYGKNGGLFDSSLRGRSPNGDVTLKPLMNRRNQLIQHVAIFGWGKYVYGTFDKQRAYRVRINLETGAIEELEGTRYSGNYVPVNNDTSSKTHYTVTYDQDSYRSIQCFDLEANLSTKVIDSTVASKQNASTLYNGCIYSRYASPTSTTCIIEKADLAVGVTTRITVEMPAGVQGPNFAKSITPIGDGKFYITCAEAVAGKTPSTPLPVTLVIWNENDNTVKIVHKDMPIQYLYNEGGGYYQQHFTPLHSYLIDNFIFFPTRIINDSNYSYFNISVLNITNGKFTIVEESDDRLRGASMATTDFGIICSLYFGDTNWYKMYTHTY